MVWKTTFFSSDFEKCDLILALIPAKIMHISSGLTKWIKFLKLPSITYQFDAWTRSHSGYAFEGLNMNLYSSC